MEKTMKRIGFVAACSVWAGKNYPLSDLTSWHLEYVIEELIAGRLDATYVMLPSIRREALMKCIRERHLKTLDAELYKAFHFSEYDDDAEAFIRRLPAFFPTSKEVNVVIFGTGLAVRSLCRKIDSNMTPLAISRSEEETYILPDKYSPIGC
jgi:hypothetical protein